jgi:excisionase family DNA binding protein
MADRSPPLREKDQMSRATNPAGGSQTQLAYTSSQAASYLGVSLATVRRWSNDGYLRGYRTPGGQRRFSGDQLDAFLRSLTGERDDDARSAA